MAQDPGSRAATFMGLLGPCRHALLGYARRALDAPADAEDVVQDAVLRAFADFARFRGGSFRAFVFTYLRHELHNANRRRRPPTLGLAQQDEPEEGEDVLARLERETTYAALLAEPERLLSVVGDGLAAGLKALRADERDVLLLRALGELRYAEIAEVCALPLGTVMTRLHRARAKVRRVLTEAELARAAGARHERAPGRSEAP